MMAITASLVRELREKTGVGMMECKKALSETSGDLEKAVVWLREKGMARAAKKSGRVAAEGVVCFELNATRTQAAMVEFNCETDFVSKNEDFLAFAKLCAKAAVDNNIESVEKLKAHTQNGETIQHSTTELISKIGENMTLRRVVNESVGEGVIGSYSHMDGKIGALVSVEGTPSDELKQLASDIAMHVAASSPRYLTSDEVEASVLAEEKEIAKKRLEEEGKPAELIEKILVGQVSKFFKEVCLVDQPFVKDPSTTIKKLLDSKSAKIKSFSRFGLGEGIEKKQENFADEVASVLS